MKKEFELGDEVFLKCGGPRMVITFLDTTKSIADLLYFRDDYVQSVFGIPLAALTEEENE